MCSSPLAGKTILITRPKHQAAQLAELVQESGGIPVVLPSNEIVPIPVSQITQQLKHTPESYDWWLFTSANGIDHFFQFLKQHRGKLSSQHIPHIATVGKKTTQKLEEKGFQSDFTPSQANGATLGAELPVSEGSHCLIPRGNLGTEDLPEKLRERGANVAELTVYQTQTCEIPEAEVREKLQKPVDAVTFTSPSSAEVLAERLATYKIQLPKVTYFCIGETTARAARSLGFEPVIVAGQKRIEGLVDEMKAYYSKSSTEKDI